MVAEAKPGWGGDKLVFDEVVIHKSNLIGYSTSGRNAPLDRPCGSSEEGNRIVTKYLSPARTQAS